mgnify:CR=1 FL=1
MFSPESTKLALDILQNEIPFAIWETVYVTIISTFLALVVGLPLGVLLVVGEKDGILPLPKSILSVLNAVINLLRSIPFLILMIMVFPVTRFFAHTVVGTAPTIVPLVFAAFPFVARLVESSLREVDGNIIGPRILGSAVGLPSIWVMFSIIAGGALFGIVGMVIGVPLFSVIYILVRNKTNERLEEKKIKLKG